MFTWNEPAWFAMLLGAALKSTVVLGAAWLLAFALRSRSAAARHLVWTAAAAALLALPVLSLSLPALRVRSHALGAMVPTVTFRTTAFAHNSARSSSLPRAGGTTVAAQNASWRPDFRLWMPAVWIAGTLLGLVHMFLAWAMMRRLRHRSRPAADTSLFSDLVQSLGVHHPVDLIELPAGAMPMNFGILHPTVFVPAEALQWSEDRRRVVLLHELAHVKRGDVATNLMMRTALCFFWWNPLAWTAWRESVKERERAADDLVLTAGEAATGYAAHLLDIARSMQSTTPVAWAAITMARPSQLEGRLLAILDSRIRRGAAGPRAPIAAALLAIALVAPFAAVQAQDKLDPETAPVVDATIRAATAQHNTEITDTAAAAFVAGHKYEAAQKLLENSLAIRAQTAGEHSSAYAAGLMKLGDLSAKRNKTDDALDFYTRAAALGDSSDTATGLIWLATHSLVAKDPAAAENFIDRALAVTPKGAVAARAMTVKADIALANGLGGLAESQYLQALAQVPSDSSQAATTMEKYAAYLTSQKRTSEAQTLLDRAKPIRQALVAQVSSRWTGADPVSKVGNGVTPPVLMTKMEPEFSEEARVSKHQGTAILKVLIGADGHAYNIEVTKSLGLGMDEKAAEAVSRWLFKPATGPDGSPIPFLAVVEVNFRLL